MKISCSQTIEVRLCWKRSSCWAYPRDLGRLVYAAELGHHLPPVYLVLQHLGMQMWRWEKQARNEMACTGWSASTDWLSLGTLACPHANCFTFHCMLLGPLSWKWNWEWLLEHNTQNCFCQSISAPFIFLTSCSSTVAAIPHFSWYIKPGSGIQMIMLNESSP